LEFAVRCEYLEKETGRELFKEYDEIISTLVSMIASSSKWVLPTGQKYQET
jgi:hypothetical protein